MGPATTLKNKKGPGSPTSLLWVRSLWLKPSPAFDYLYNLTARSAAHVQVDGNDGCLLDGDAIVVGLLPSRKA
jgi:hypothetical protein